MSARRSSTRQGSEAQFQQQVEQLAKHYGWRAYHAPDNRPGRNGKVQRVTAGFLDLVLVRPPELIFAELKTDKGRLRPEQADWIKELQAISTAVADAVHRAEIGGHGPIAAGEPAVDVYIWRPADFDDMHARLARGRRRERLLYREEAGAA
jgi:hypothetical protein